MKVNNRLAKFPQLVANKLSFGHGIAEQIIFIVINLMGWILNNTLIAALLVHYFSNQADFIPFPIPISIFDLVMYTELLCLAIVVLTAFIAYLDRQRNRRRVRRLEEIKSEVKKALEELSLNS